jgi:hypothetical protein
MGPGLEGTGRVADDLFLLAHSDLTGRPYIQPRPLGLGLAAGLLAELVVAGALVVAGDQITVTGRRRPPGDALAGQVLGLVAGEREGHPGWRPGWAPPGTWPRPGGGRRGGPPGGCPPTATAPSPRSPGVHARGGCLISLFAQLRGC